MEAVTLKKCTICFVRGLLFTKGNQLVLFFTICVVALEMPQVLLKMSKNEKLSFFIKRHFRFGVVLVVQVSIICINLKCLYMRH